MNVAQSFPFVGIATEANAIAAPAVANVRGNAKGVLPIAGIKEPNVVGKHTESVNESTDYGNLGFA